MFTENKKRNKDRYILASDVKEYNVYMLKDGRIAIYFGKSISSKYLFVGIAQLWVSENFKRVSGNFKRDYHVYNSQLQFSSLYNLIHTFLRSELDNTAVMEFSTFPNIGEELNIDVRSLAEAYKSKLLQNGWQFAIEDSKTKKKNPNTVTPVSAKELIIGKCYVCGLKDLGTEYEGWRNSWVYLGRDEENYFQWIFVGDPRDYTKNIKGTLMAYNEIYGVERTKNNKKVYEPRYYKNVPILPAETVKMLISHQNPKNLW